MWEFIKELIAFLALIPFALIGISIIIMVITAIISLIFFWKE